MEIAQNIDLKQHSTMRLGGIAKFCTDINSRFDIPKALEWADERSLPVKMIGGGSNIIWPDAGFDGLLLLSKIKGIEIMSQDEGNLYLSVGAGENWDSVVEKTVELGFADLATLSLIPGTVGATPIQNVGAYGSEVSQTIATIEVFDSADKKFTNLQGFECDFGYRTSRFKTTDFGRFYITGVTFHLTNKVLEPPFYASLQHYFTEHSIKHYTPLIVRQSVIALRSRALPSIDVIPNCGSFFANPIVDQNKLASLVNEYPNIQYWQLEDGMTKLSAGWLLENAGYKGIHDESTGMGTWVNQAIVVVNEQAKTTDNLIKFVSEMQAKINRLYGIKLEQEPELVS